MSRQKGKATEEEFDALLEEVIAHLPDDFRTFLDEVPVIVEDEPSEELSEPSDLCGMHWGIPLSERTVLDGMVMPPQIFIYRGPIRRLAGRGGAPLARQIRITLLHEIGHHFGLTEERLEELGYG